MKKILFVSKGPHLQKWFHYHTFVEYRRSKSKLIVPAAIILTVFDSFEELLKLLIMNESTCSLADFAHYSITHYFPKEVYYIVSIANSLILATATLGNIGILAALRRCRTLHPPSKALLYSLVLSDLGVAVVVIPLKLALNLAVVLRNPSLYCLLWRPFRIIAAVMGTVSFFTSTAIALDRYLAFRLQMRYRQVITLRKVVLLLIAEWILAIIWACTEVVNETLNRVLGTLAILSCVVITLVCYQRIYKGLRRQAELIQVQCQPTTNQNNGSSFSVGEYKRTVGNMVWVYCCLLVCYVPYYLNLILLIAFDSHALVLAKNVTSVVIYSNSSLNPVIYCWKIKEIRKESFAIYRNICQPM